MQATKASHQSRTSCSETGGRVDGNGRRAVASTAKPSSDRTSTVQDCVERSIPMMLIDAS